MKNYKTQLVALAEFANGTSYRIEQIKASGACRITDTNDGKTSYSSSIANAWKNVRYQARLNYKYENTTMWPSRMYFERGQEAHHVSHH
jgi:hypothetical protein